MTGIDAPCVIPAQAGTQATINGATSLGSRLRGNDVFGRRFPVTLNALYGARLRRLPIRIG